MAVNNKSYIIVTCETNAAPELNQLQLRTDPPTFIMLKPGMHKYTIEDYSGLKFGFKPKQFEHSWSEPNPNCQSAVKIDMSHFDASAVKSTNHMFDCMCNLRVCLNLKDF